LILPEVIPGYAIRALPNCPDGANPCLR
jgi:hypothetical protein